MVSTAQDAAAPQGMPQPPLVEKGKIHWNYWLLIAGALIGASLFVIPAPAGVNANGWRTLGLLIPIIVVWGTEAIPVGVAALGFLALVVAFHLVGPDIAFKGFTNNLPWLLIGAFAIGAAMERTGLSKRMAYFLLSHLRGFWGINVATYIANLCLVGVPSVAARAGIMAPALHSLMVSIDNPKDSNASRILTFNFINSSHAFLSNMVLTGGVVNTLMLAFYSTLSGGHTLTWVQWLIIMALPSVIYCAFGLLGVVLFYPPEPEIEAKLRDSKAARNAYAALGPMSADEWKVLGMFVLAIFLWVIGGTIKLDPGFAALIVMALLFLPKVGVLPAKALREINWDIALLVGAAIGLAGILDQTGMLKTISSSVIGPILNPLASFGLVGIAAACILVGLAAHFILPSPSNCTLVFPLMMSWGFTTLHLPAAEVLVFLGILSVFGNQAIMLAYQFPTYYIFLGLDVTDGPKFNALLTKIYPFLIVGMLLATYVTYVLIKATGFGI